MTAKPPTWFWIVSVVLLLWGIVGFGGFVMDAMLTPEMLAGMTEYDREYRLAEPGWIIAVYGVATATGLAGAIALLLRRQVARPIYIVSLLFVVLLFGWALLLTDLVAAKGFLGAAGFPIVIALIGAFSIWFSGLALRRGWIA